MNVDRIRTSRTGRCGNALTRIDHRTAVGSVLALCVVLAACSCAISARQQAYRDFGPAADGAYRLDIRSYPREISVGEELVARYVLTNTSDEWVRGCVSVNRVWTFNGRRGSYTVEKTTTHVICDSDRQFFLSQGESHSWLDGVEVPEAGDGETEVIARIEIVLVDPRGRVEPKRRWEVEQSITIVIATREGVDSQRGFPS